MERGRNMEVEAGGHEVTSCLQTMARSQVILGTRVLWLAAKYFLLL
jgi:hypothetical protein